MKDMHSVSEIRQFYTSSRFRQNSSGYVFIDNIGVYLKQDVKVNAACEN